MPPKSKKIDALWKACERCKVTIPLKYAEMHDANCPCDLAKWDHPFVKEAVLHSTLACNIDSNGLSLSFAHDYVFISQTVMHLCGFIIGEYVLLNLRDKNAWLVKRTWPCLEKNLTTVFVSQKVYDKLNIKSKETNVRVFKLHSSPLPLKTIYIKYLTHPKKEIMQDLNTFVEGYYSDKIIQIADTHTINFFGTNYNFIIVKIEVHETSHNLEHQVEQLSIHGNDVPALYNLLPSTKWVYMKNTEENLAQISLSSIGGLNNVILELRDALSFALGLHKSLPILRTRAMRGILLFGHTGCGKTLLAKSISKDIGAKLIEIRGPEIFSKFFGATEAALTSAFAAARENDPTVILLDEVDSLCPARPGTEQERRVASTLLHCLDELQEEESTYVAVIATTNRPESLDSAIRRSGRLDTEIELPVPDAAARLDILKKTLSRMPNQCTTSTLLRVSKTTHGCTGADLVGLISLAASQAVAHLMPDIMGDHPGKSVQEHRVIITDSDLAQALTKTKPSAMREVSVEVPDVKWGDIGGQHDLKLKLKQAVEWPLTHPESFIKLGITPPRGVLMYGPPGCSKTMIAKALASESGLNFLSIKGPELFSQFVGESERAVREVFRRARRVAPSIVFFDEIDALGTSRSTDTSGSSSNVQERVLAQLLTELDGVTPLGNVTVVAATNRPDRLDRALLRPGRLDRIVYVPLPDLDTRREIFALALSKMPVTPEVDLENLALQTEGYSGAEIRAVCHEAAMIALEENLQAQQIRSPHFEFSLIRIQPRTPKELLKLYEEYANEK